MNDMIITQCAWCHDVKVGGRFTRLGLPVIVHEIDLPTKNGKSNHYYVSHGICRPCKEKLMHQSLAA